MVDSIARRSILGKIDALRSSQVFADVAEPIIEKAASVALARRLRRGDALYFEGEPVTAVFMVSKGELNSVRDNGHGKQQVLSVERRGAVLAAAALFTNGRYYCTVVADCDSEVLCLQAQHVRSLCREYPDLLWNFASLLGHKANEYAELIEALVFRSVDQRVAQQLIRLAAAQNTCSGGLNIQFTLTRAEMASRVAATREAVSRALAHLQELGLIDVRGYRGVQILDINKLRAYAAAPTGAGSGVLSAPA